AVLRGAGQAGAGVGPGPGAGGAPGTPAGTPAGTGCLGSGGVSPGSAALFAHFDSRPAPPTIPSMVAHKGLRRAAALSLLSALSLLTTLLVPNMALAAGDPCANVGVNPIPCENSKPGTDPSIWDAFTGAGDANLQGFPTDIGVN